MIRTFKAVSSTSNTYGIAPNKSLMVMSGTTNVPCSTTVVPACFGDIVEVRKKETRSVGRAVGRRNLAGEKERDK